MKPDVAVIGAGSFGTCLACVLARTGTDVYLWGRDADVIHEIDESRQHPTRLPGIKIPADVIPTADLDEAMSATFVVHAIPAQQTRGFWQDHQHLLKSDGVILLAAKGLERDTGLRLDEVFTEIFGDGFVDQRLAALSGPTFATEVAAGIPSVALVAARDHRLATAFQGLLAGPTFRIYTSTDLTGVEIAGAVKNVFAIAAGVSDGIGLGLNTRAAIVTRGLAEMIRFGEAQGAELQTFCGLAGVGDLLLTATGDLSRNRTLGKRIGAGEKVDDILADMTQVAEGVPTTASTIARAEELGVELPIVEQVGEILFDGKDPEQAVFDLMTRTLKKEG